MRLPSGPPCDLVILTALRLEFQAVTAYLQETREEIHPQGTVYLYGTFPSEHRLWRVAVTEIGMGGPNAATQTERALTFFQPELAFFVGVAGGIKDVRLGDVVVASKVYGYESGKARQVFEPRPELWRADPALEQRAKAEARESRWLARLGTACPSPAPDVFVVPLAAGEKVMSSRRASVYRFLRRTYGDALAVEMEGHGFSQAVHANFAMRGLVIRGISDLIEQKAETDASGSQHTAARHAAAFAFEVLARFTLPSTIPSVWNVPFARNLFFTGRDDLLGVLHAQLHHRRSIALSQPQAISGLGGIGKTQIAVEYAYQHRQDYQAVLWTLADTRESLVSGYIAIAGELNLPEKDAQDQAITVQAVGRWLTRNTGWLLILDNADDLAMVREFLPAVFGGHLLLTTRAAAMGGLAQRVEVESMPEDIGALFLLRRAGLLAHNASLDQADPAERSTAREITKELGGLPLALDQAGAYLEETQCGLGEYLHRIQTHHTALLKRRGGLRRDYPESVGTTWALSFEKVEQKNPAAADLLRLCAFLAPDAIPEEILIEGAPHLGPVLEAVASDAFVRDQAIEDLRAYSLIERSPTTHTLSMHRLVQAVLREWMEEQSRRAWRQRAVRAVDTAFPYVEHQTWPQCEQFVPHALRCAEWIEQDHLSDSKAAHLLNQAGFYLSERARYHEAESLYLRALSIYEQALGPSHPNTASCLNNLAALYRAQGKYAEAEPLYQRAFSIWEQQLGPSHPDTALSLNNLAGLYRAQGKDAEAEPLLMRALSIDEQALGPSHPDTATDLSNLALLYHEQGKYAEAESLLMRALSIWEQALGPSHPDTARSLNNLAELYRTQGKYAEAESLYLRALSIREQALGPSHADTARSLNNLAELYRAQGKYAEAEPLLMRALSIYEQALGPSHPNTASCLNNLALLYRAQDKYAEAEPLLKQALSIWEQELGPSHPDTRIVRRNYALFLRKAGREAEAAQLEAEDAPSSS